MNVPRPESGLPARTLEQTARSFSNLRSGWLVMVPAPIGLTVLVFTGGYLLAGGADPGFPPQFPLLVYAVANVVVLIIVYVRTTDEVWRASALFRTPSRTELGAGVVVTVVGVAFAWPLTTLLAQVVGVTPYTVPTLGTVGPIIVLFVGSVVVAPVAEEILYRGLFFGVVLERGYGPLVAGASSLLVFAGVHVFTAGVAGVVNALLLGVLLTGLRLWFDNLVGAWLLHTLNNLLEFLIAVSILPSIYAL